MSGMTDHTPPRLTLAVPTSVGGPERVETELAAMAAIADALTSVADDAARFRVVRWAVELYASNADAESRKQDAAGDLTLEPAPPPVLAAPVAVEAPLCGAVKTPDFDDVEFPVRGASDATLVVGDLESLFPAFDDDGDLDMLALEADSEPVSDQPVDSMIERFVKDFQKLARDWENA